jgi:hypothetical protein
MALRIALPCLALSVVMSACSNDDALEYVVVDNNVSTGMVFKASFPVSEGEVSTRMGLNENLIPLNPNITEPLIWIDGDKLSFNFVKNGMAGQVVEYKVTDVADRGRSCSLVPVTTPTFTEGDGTYTVYAVTPSSPNNFLNGFSNFCNVNLTNQSQPSVVDNYKNLSNYLYLYAKTTVEVENGALKSGNSLSFAIATSLLRFNVTNATGAEATVDKITISHTGSSDHPFYSTRVFDPTKSTGMFSNGTTVGSLTLETDKVLSDGGKFDAYLSIFPTEGFADAADNKIAIRVDYLDADGEPKHKDFEWSVSAFSSNPPYAVFRSSGRFLFNLTLDEGEEELPDEDDPYANDPSVFKVGDYYYSLTKPHQSYINYTDNAGGYIYYPFQSDPLCTDGWLPINYYISTISVEEIQALWAISAFRGMTYGAYTQPHYLNLDILAIKAGSGDYRFYSYDGSYVQGSHLWNDFAYRIICCREL